MARKLSRREIGLVVVLASAGIGYLWMTGGSGPGGDGDGTGPVKASDLPQAPVVRMDLLAANVADYGSGGRDLFKYYTPPAPPPKRVIPQNKPTPKPIPKPPPRPVQNAASRDTGPRMPRITLKYIGYLGPKDDRIAVFEDGKDLVLGRAGEVLRDDFRVVEIQYESVVMGFTDPKFKDKTQTLARR